MKCQNNMVVAVLTGIVVGVLMGAGMVQYAQLIAFQGANPIDAKNSMYMRHRLIPNKEGKIPRPTTRSLRLGLEPQYRPLEVPDQETIHRAAPQGEVPEHCKGLTGTRRTHCVGEFEKDGTYYQLWETPRP